MEHRNRVKNMFVASGIDEFPDLDDIPDGVQALPIMEGPIEGSPFEGVSNIHEFNAKARELAKDLYIKNDNSLRPTVAIMSKDKVLLGFPLRFENDNDKDLMAEAVRAICKSIEAKAVAFASEVWFLSMAKENDVLDRNGNLKDGPIRNHPKKIEGISVMTEWKGSKSTMSIMQIARDEDGKVRGIIEHDGMTNTEADHSVGRFANFLGT